MGWLPVQLRVFFNCLLRFGRRQTQTQTQTRTHIAYSPQSHPILSHGVPFDHPPHASSRLCHPRRPYQPQQQANNQLNFIRFQCEKDLKSCPIKINDTRTRSTPDIGASTYRERKRKREGERISEDPAAARPLDIQISN